MDNNNNNKLRFWIPRKSNRPNQRFSSLHTTDESVFFLFFFSFIPLVVAVAVVVHRIRACFRRRYRRHSLTVSQGVGWISLGVLVSLSFTKVLPLSIQHSTESYPSPPSPPLARFCACFFFFFSLLSPHPQTPYTPLNPNNAKKAVQTTQLFLVVAVSLAYHTLQPPSNPQ